MRIEITKETSDDRIAIRRDDGTSVHMCFPKKGPVPHDAVHVIVERKIGLTRGFWGMIAAGTDPDMIQEIAKSAGHASAGRADVPAPHIVELIQAERLVECFEAALWGGDTDPATLRDVARVACEASHVPTPSIDDATIAEIVNDVRALHSDWTSAPVGYLLALDWPA